MPVGGDRGGPQRDGRLGRRLPGVQLRLGLPPPRVPGAVRAAQPLPGLRGAAPRLRIAGPGQPGPLGVPAGALGWVGGREPMLGERGPGHVVHPRHQVVSGGLGGVGGGFVAACPGLFGQVGAGPHARRQQPPAEDGQVRDLEQPENPPDLLQGVAGAPRPHRQLRGPLRGLASVVNVVAQTGGDGVGQPTPRGGGVGIAAQQVDVGPRQVHQPAIAVRRPGDQRVDQRRGLGRAPAGQQRFRSVRSQDGGPPRGLQAGLPGGSKGAQRHLGGTRELGQLEQRVAFVRGQPHQGAGVVRGPGQGPPPPQDRETFLDLPAPELARGDPGQHARNQSRGAGRFGDLQRPVQRGEGAIGPSPGGPQEHVGVIEPRLGLIG